MTVAYPIKGTAFFNQIESKIIGQSNWETTTDRDLDFVRTHSPKYYTYAVPWLIRSVWLSKNFKAGFFSLKFFRNYFTIKLLRLAMLYYRRNTK